MKASWKFWACVAGAWVDMILSMVALRGLRSIELAHLFLFSAIAFSIGAVSNYFNSPKSPQQK